MKNKKMANLESDAEAHTVSAGRIPNRKDFNMKDQTGRYGDLRLLGLSAGFVLLIIVNFLLRSDEAHLMETNVMVEEAVVFAPPAFAARAEDEGLMRAAFNESVYYFMDLDDSPVANPAVRTPERKEWLTHEMAKGIAKGAAVN